MAAAAPRFPDDKAREARDVIAFGQETGRVLSDGRIVGRAEPFAKVFPSSRVVKRADAEIIGHLMERRSLTPPTTPWLF
jgi:hypothetical protein